MSDQLIVYMITETRFEYDDEFYYTSGSIQDPISRIFLSKERAEQARRDLTINALLSFDVTIDKIEIVDQEPGLLERIEKIFKEHATEKSKWKELMEGKMPLDPCLLTREGLEKLAALFPHNFFFDIHELTLNEDELDDFIHAVDQLKKECNKQDG